MRAHLIVDAPLLAIAGAGLGAGYGLAPAIAAVGLGLATHAWGVFHPRSPLYLPVHWRFPSETNAVAITFDDGPDPAVTPYLLDALAHHGAKATFFVIGEHVRSHPALVARMISEGHGVGLHGHGHSRCFNLWPAAKVRSDLDLCAQAIADATGLAAPRLFRPPVGLKNPIIARVVRERDLVCVTWTAKSRDTSGATTAGIVRNLRWGMIPGGILLLHDGHEPRRKDRRDACIAALPELLGQLADRGLQPRALIANGSGVSAQP